MPPAPRTSTCFERSRDTIWSTARTPRPSPTATCGTSSATAACSSPDPTGNPACAYGVEPGMQVEIWSDVVCPWCYVGKRRFEQALDGFAHADDVTVTYRSFELDPEAPTARTGNHAEHLARKYGLTV